MALQNYVDKVGPVVSALWLNEVDVLKFSIFADAATKALARTALTSDAALELVNGGSGGRTVQNFRQVSGQELCTVGGSPNAITLTPFVPATSYFGGQTLFFIPTANNTAAVVVNVSGLGNKDVTKGGAIALAANDLVAGAMVAIINDGTRFQVVSGASMSGAAILAALLLVDGPGSGLDADFLDGLSSANFSLISIAQNIQAGNYTLVLEDNGKHIFHASGAGAGDIYTIPANASVAFPIGANVTFVNRDVSPVTISITADTMVLAGSALTGSRSLTQNGIATAIKVETAVWIISGQGLA